MLVVSPSFCTHLYHRLYVKALDSYAWQTALCYLLAVVGLMDRSLVVEALQFSRSEMICM